MPTSEVTLWSILQSTCDSDQFKQEVDSKEISFLEFLNHTNVVFAPQTRTAFIKSDSQQTPSEEDIEVCLEALENEFSVKEGWNHHAVSLLTSSMTRSQIDFSQNCISVPHWRRFCYLFGRDNFLRALNSAEMFISTSSSGRWAFLKNKSPNRLAHHILSRNGMMYHFKHEARKVSVLPESCDSILRMINNSLNPLESCNSKILRKLKAILRKAKVKDSHLNYFRLFRSKVKKNDSLPESCFSDVVRFVRAVMDGLFSSSLLGSSRNWKKLHQFLVNFLQGKKKSDHSVEELIKSLDVQSIPWLCNDDRAIFSRGQRLKGRILSNFFKWLCCTLVARVVRSFWYVTQTSGRAPASGSDVAFIPHDEWQRISASWLSGYKSRYLTQGETETKTDSDSRFSLGSLRLIPKSNDFRPLCIPLRYQHLPKAVRLSSEEIRKSYILEKQVLGPVRDILRYQQSKRAIFKFPNHAKCYSSNDVMKALSSFRQKAGTQLYGKPMFAIKFDMKHCYDNLNQAKVIQCVRDLFEGEEDNILLCTSASRVTSAIYPKQVKVVTDRANIEKLYSNQHLRQDAISCGSHSFKTSSIKLRVFDLFDMVFDQVVHGRIIMRDESGTFYRKTGVFQGTPLSATFCDVLYDRLVWETFAYLREETDSLLIRLADDFLIISQRRAICDKVYADACSDQFKAYGAYVNSDKSEFYQSSEDQRVIKFVGLNIQLPSLDQERQNIGLAKPPQRITRSIHQTLDWIQDFLKRKISDLSFTHSIMAKKENIERLTKHALDILGKSLLCAPSGNLPLAEDVDLLLMSLFDAMLEEMRDDEIDSVSAEIRPIVSSAVNQWKKRFRR